MATKDQRARPPAGQPTLPVAANTLGLFAPRICHGQIVSFTSQLAVMVQSGIPLADALEGIRRQERHAGFQGVLGKLHESLERGETFSTALERFPRLFDRRYVAVVKAAEASGSLGGLLEQLALALRKSAETRARVRAALAYPLAMLIMAIGVSIFLLTFVLPKFTPLFESRRAALPIPTRLVLAISHAVTDWWYLWAAGGVFLVAGAILVGRVPQGRKWLDRVRLGIPILGPVVQKAAICQSIRTLGTLLSGGVPMLEALRLTAEAAGNAIYEQLWHQVAEQVAVGKPLSECLAHSSLVPPTVVQMVHAGEESGRLSEILGHLAEYLEADVDITIKGATSLMEPILIAVMGVIVGTIGLAVLLPIFSLSRPM
jgi:type IV pilus assembly protein PilC